MDTRKMEENKTTITLLTKPKFILWKVNPTGKSSARLTEKWKEDSKKTYHKWKRGHGSIANNFMETKMITQSSANKWKSVNR